MAFCSNCGGQLNDDDRFCPGCGGKTELKMNQENTTPINLKITGIIIRDVFISIFGFPFLCFGAAFVTTIIIGSFAKIPSMFIGAVIMMIFGIIIGLIPAKIGEYIMRSVDTKNIREGTIALSVIIGVIIGFTQVHKFLTMLSGY